MWYDLEREDYKGLAQSQEMLTEWLQSLENLTGIPLASTILCGFSQGGAMTLDVGLTLPLAGLICLSHRCHQS
jgi:phospholipase/carboxylesterase